MPLKKPTLTSWRGFKLKVFNSISALTRKAQLSGVTTIVSCNGSPLLICQDLTQYWFDKIKKSFSNKSDPSQCSVGLTICICSESGRLQTLMWRKDGILRAFLPLAFLESLSELPFASRGFARFKRHSFAQLPAWRFFLWMS